MGLRIGVDVGGTFTKAAAVELRSGELVASASVPTTYDEDHGVSRGLVEALHRLLEHLGARRVDVELVAFSTTQAMNALLEGDVARVGVIGMGQAPDLRRARKRTHVARVGLAPGRNLEVESAFLDTGNGLPVAEAREALERMSAAGTAAIAVSEAFGVDAPEHEATVAALARERGMPACAGHELVGTYGLEMRTLSAAINASILPVIQRTATLVESALARSDLDVPLLVLRGDGGAMDMEGFRRTPVFTLSSGPAAGVAAALHELDVSDAVVLESGGTSSNVSVIKGGRPALRTVKVMGRPTCVRSIDSWVVGAAGGSMGRLRRRGIAEVGPRSAHIAGLPYACFASPEELVGADLARVAPRAGDPATYAAVRSPRATYAITATCAANALGLVPAGDYAHGSGGAAQHAFAALGKALKKDAEILAREFVELAADKIAAAVEEAAHQHKLPREAPIVALGGAAGALAPVVAERVGRRVEQPVHAEVLSSIGTALSLIRAQVERSAPADADTLDVAREAELACVRSGAAPNTVAVETSYDARHAVVRAVATGAVALEAGAAGRQPIGTEDGRTVASRALSSSAESLELVAETDYYRIYSENGSGKVAVIDPSGAVSLAESAAQIISGSPEEVSEQLTATIDRRSIRVGLATVPPRVFLVCGPHLLDLSAARRPEEIVEVARRAIAEHPDHPVAIVVR